MNVTKLDTPNIDITQYQKKPKHNYYQKAASIKERKDKTKADPDIVPHTSDEFLQCVDPSELLRKKKKNVDEHTEEVTKSCLDLAIDG